MIIERLDHLVLTVGSIRTSSEFYRRVLHMEVVESGGRTSLFFGSGKINLHRHGEEFSPHALHPLPGTADLCFLTSMPLDDFIRHCGIEGLEIIEGPVPRAGARGKILSVYLRDPDGNLLEVANRLPEGGPEK